MIFFDIDGTLYDHKHAEYLGAIAFYREHLPQLLWNDRHLDQPYKRHTA